jgi:hypothetical protein
MVYTLKAYFQFKSEITFLVLLQRREQLPSAPFYKAHLPFHTLPLSKMAQWWFRRVSLVLEHNVVTYICVGNVFSMKLQFNVMKALFMTC